MKEFFPAKHIYENEKHLEQRLKYTYQSMPSAFFDKKVLLSTPYRFKKDSGRGPSPGFFSVP